MRVHVVATAGLLMYLGACANLELDDDRPRGPAYVQVAKGEACALDEAARTGARPPKSVCANGDISDTLPQRAALDGDTDVIALGISHFRSDGPPFAPGNAVAAAYMFDLLIRVRIHGAVSSMSTDLENGRVSLEGSKFARYITLTSRSDPTRLMANLDATIRKLDRPLLPRRFPTFDFSGSHWDPGSREVAAPHIRITKALVNAEIQAQKARVEKQPLVRSVLGYLATYSVQGPDGSVYLMGSDSRESDAATMVPLAAVVSAYEEIARMRPDAVVVLVFDTERRGTPVLPASQAPRLSSPQNLVIVDAGRAAHEGWYWRADTRHKITLAAAQPATPAASGVPAKPAVPARERMLDSARESRMSLFPLALATALKTCEETDVDTDDVPTISMGQWVDNATKVYASWRGSVALHAAPSANLARFGPPLFCPAAADMPLRD